MRTTIKRITDKTVSIAVTIALIFAMLFGVISFSTFRSIRAAHAADDIEEFPTTSLSLSNTDFSDASGSYPMTPTNWTGAHVDDGDGNVIAGVVDLKPETYVTEGSGNEKFKLDQYTEYSSKDKLPVTIFGANKDEGGEEKALLINAHSGSSVAYAFSSADMTFAANSFYHVSVWVKTGNFAADTGATVKLNGLGENCSFLNINTVANLPKNADKTPILDKENNYGWVQYGFYVRTSPSVESTVQLSLGIGDAFTESDEDPEDGSQRQARGYAFFDTVRADRISAENFAFNTASFTQSAKRDNVYYSSDKHTLALDLYNTDFLTTEDEDDGTIDIGSFSNGLKGWNIYPEYDPDQENVSSTGSIVPNIFNSHVDGVDDESGLTVNPRSPFGKAENDTFIGNNPMFSGTNGNILMLSTYDKTAKKFTTAAGGVASPDVTIKRFRYYRFGVWVKTDSISGGTGASVGVKGESNVADDDMKITNSNGRVTGVTGDSSDTAHYGWKEQVIYIKGSAVKDCTVHFELWLGSPDSQSAGIAMFDNVTFTELSYTDYSKMSAADGGTVLSLDAQAESTGVSNGTFTDVGDYDEFKFPLPPAEWTYNTPDTVTSLGFNKNEVNTDNAVYGLIPSDSESFKDLKASGDIPANVTNPSQFATLASGNILLLSSKTPTAFCYQSATFTASTDKANTVTVQMAVDGVKTGYGASLVLKTESGAVISTIENITNTHNDYKTFTFYLDAPLSDQTLVLEIWLGLNDRKNNTQKLSEGNIYVKSVSFEEWTVGDDTTIEVEFQNKLNTYLAAASNPTAVNTLDFGIYSFGGPSLNYYDIYTYNLIGGYGTLYGWDVSTVNKDNFVGGLFNTDNMRALSVYDGFAKKDESGTMLLINNTAPNRTTFSYGNKLQLVSNSYYRLDVTLKVRIDDAVRNNKNIVGASLALTGTSTEKFENIKDTTTLVSQKNEDSRDYETFKTFTFFISTGDEGGELGLDIGFGGDSTTSYIQGQLIVSDVKLGSINNTAYEAAKADLDEDYQKAIEFSSTADNTDDGSEEKVKTEIAWWIIPTVIFSAALLAVIVIIIAVRIRDHVKKKKKKTYTSDYDRTSAIKSLDELAENTEAKESDKSKEPEENNNEEGTEDLSESVKEEKPEEETESPATEEAPEKEEKTTSSADDLND